VSLDKWIKEPPKKSKAPVKKKPKKVAEKKIGIEQELEIIEEVKKSPLGKIQKFKLKCPDRKCKYEKIKVKLKLTERDKVCPKCSKQMKIEKI
jgi:hypothetical protein